MLLHSASPVSKVKRRPSICKNTAASNDANIKHQLVVDGLPQNPRINDVRSLFGRFGAVVQVRLEQELNRAFVAFSTAEALQMAVAAPPPRLLGEKLRVSLPKAKECVWGRRNQNKSKDAVGAVLPPTRMRSAKVDDSITQEKPVEMQTTTSCLQDLVKPRDHSRTHDVFSSRIQRRDQSEGTNDVKLYERRTATPATAFYCNAANLNEVRPEVQARMPADPPRPALRGTRLEKTNISWARRKTETVTEPLIYPNHIGLGAHLPRDHECRLNDILEKNGSTPPDNGAFSRWTQRLLPIESVVETESEAKSKPDSASDDQLGPNASSFHHNDASVPGPEARSNVEYSFPYVRVQLSLCPSDPLVWRKIPHYSFFGHIIVDSFSNCGNQSHFIESLNSSIHRLHTEDSRHRTKTSVLDGRRPHEDTDAIEATST
ncbi:hypothetical protein TcWFU_007591 [Taenia crassiceps]|uniref:RRM domain-containing protein n=1 Tax=Taenia crassiceps TaxID=6207 RepID=A0ABR4Q2M2_9CEST